MSELTESLKVSKNVKEKLDDIKDDDEHASYDSVIRTLLHESELYRMMKPKKKPRRAHE